MIIIYSQQKVCAIESARFAQPRCYGAFVGFRKELLCGSWLMCDTYIAIGVYFWRISKSSISS
jgi:hypothetical protein